MKYSANITAGALKVAESRLIADLLLHQLDPNVLRKVLVETNVLQASAPLTAIRIGGLIHARLTLMGPGLWRMVRDGTTTISTQACLAAAIKHSALLGDFMDLVLRQFYRHHIDALPTSAWEDYLIDCRAREPEMPNWQESTQQRLRSTVYQTLAQSGYIESTRTRRLQAVHIARPLLEYLRNNEEHYVLRCIEVSP